MNDGVIVLFPRTYNKRGDERLHSVQGVTLEGEEVNIKLRVDESMLGKESTPSISEFSREDVKAKNPCLASPDNSISNREGVLLFTGCEPDKENRRSLPTFIARWGYVLASHSEAPEPIFGTGRVAIVKNSQSLKTIENEIRELKDKKPLGWEATVDRKRKQLEDPLQYSYFGQIYMTEDEAEFMADKKDEIIDFCSNSILENTSNGVVGGILIRFKDSSGQFIKDKHEELFPRWIGNDSYQSGSDVLSWYYRSNTDLLNDRYFVSIMPIKRYSCGPSFKNYYFLKNPADSLLKLKRKFFINDQPSATKVAFVLNRREDTGEHFLSKYYSLSEPIGSIARLGSNDIELADKDKEIDYTVYHVGFNQLGSIVFADWVTPNKLLMEPLPKQENLIDSPSSANPEPDSENIIENQNSSMDHINLNENKAEDLELYLDLNLSDISNETGEELGSHAASGTSITDIEKEKTVEDDCLVNLEVSSENEQETVKPAIGGLGSLLRKKGYL